MQIGGAELMDTRMAVFPSYIELKNKYLDAQHALDRILREKESLFARTQPGSPTWDKTTISPALNNFDDYLAAKESARVEERLTEARSILEERGRLLTLKKTELYCSTHVFDKIFKMRFLENHSIPKIIDCLHFSKSQVYRFLDSIKKIGKGLL